MGVLKNLTEEYFGKTERMEDVIELPKSVTRVSFTDCNGKIHKNGYQPKSRRALINIMKELIKKRGYEGDFNDVDTSKIKDMEAIFSQCDFNGDISGWNTQKVTTMRYMFFLAKKFNKPIGNWDVKNVKDMYQMFTYAEDFNQDLSGWEVSRKETIVSNMLFGTKVENDIKKYPKLV